MDVTQQQIINALGGTPHFDAANEAERRIDFLVKYLKESGQSGYVLGISGGIVKSATSASTIPQGSGKFGMQKLAFSPCLPLNLQVESEIVRGAQRRGALGFSPIHFSMKKA